MILLLACREPPPISPEPVPLPSLEQALGDEGFVIRRGSQSYYDHLDCCDREGLCLYNNPSSPYGYLSLPAGPDQTGEDLEPAPDGGHRWFHLRRDEAIVVIGQAPPRARYFSSRSYLATRSTPSGRPRLVIGSLGPSTNHRSMAERRGTEIWGEPYALVTTADPGIEDRVHRALLASGFEDRAIHDDRIPESLVRLGLDPEADRLMVTSRIAVFEDPEAGTAYLDDPMAAVLRLTPTAPLAEERSHPILPLPEKGSGTDEGGWQEAVDALEQAILDRWPDRSTARRVSVAGREVDPLDCLSSLATCGGEINDRYYGYLGEPLRLTDDGGFLVVFGVNHQRTGKASYAGFSVDTALHLLAIAGVDSDQMVGSAGAWLPDHPLVDDLYAWLVARSCEGIEEPCLEIPVECPGSPTDRDLSVSFRAYLEPATGAAPLYEEMIPDRALLFGAP